MIISIPEITICAPEIIAGVPSIIVCIVGKIESLTALIASRIEIVHSHSSTISDGVELTATQTQLIAAIPAMIPSKGKTGNGSRICEEPFKNYYALATLIFEVGCLICLDIEVVTKISTYIKKAE